MSSKPQHFARTVLAAFDEAGLTSDALVHEAGGPSSTYMTGLRKAADGAAMTEPRSDTYRRIDDAALWERGSAREVWAGRDPVPRLAPLSGMDLLREAVGQDVPVRTRMRGPFRKRYSDGPDGFTERVLDRVLDLEERVDAIESLILAERQRASDEAPIEDILKAAARKNPRPERDPHDQSKDGDDDA